MKRLPKADDERLRAEGRRWAYTARVNGLRAKKQMGQTALTRLARHEFRAETVGRTPTDDDVNVRMSAARFLDGSLDDKETIVEGEGATEPEAVAEEAAGKPVPRSSFHLDDVGGALLEALRGKKASPSAEADWVSENLGVADKDVDESGAPSVRAVTWRRVLRRNGAHTVRFFEGTMAKLAEVGMREVQEQMSDSGRPDLEILDECAAAIRAQRSADEESGPDLGVAGQQSEDEVAGELRTEADAVL